jgi:hypothetical protein
MSCRFFSFMARLERSPHLVRHDCMRADEEMTQLFFLTHDSPASQEIHWEIQWPRSYSVQIEVDAGGTQMRYARCAPDTRSPHPVASVTRPSTAPSGARRARATRLGQARASAEALVHSGVFHGSQSLRWARAQRSLVRSRFASPVPAVDGSPDPHERPGIFLPSLVRAKGVFILSHHTIATVLQSLRKPLRTSGPG